MRVGSQLHALAALPPGKRPGIHCIGGWVGSKAGLDGCGKSRLHQDSNPGPSRARSESLYGLSHPGPHNSMQSKLNFLLKFAKSKNDRKKNARS
jgi:hypothetical protein